MEQFPFSLGRLGQERCSSQAVVFFLPSSWRTGDESVDFSYGYTIPGSKLAPFYLDEIWYA